MENLFVPYNIAKQLKEKGFDETCFGWFVSDKSKELVIGVTNSSNLLRDAIVAPIYQQTIEWFREKHNIDVQYYSNKFSYTVQVVYDTEGDNVCKYIVHNISKGELKSEMTKAIAEALKLI